MALGHVVVGFEVFWGLKTLLSTYVVKKFRVII